MRPSPLHARPPSPRLCGFTLIELLTVIAIIGILSLLVSLAWRPVMRASRLAKCGANLRGVFVALELYAADNKNEYPFTYGKVPSGNGTKDVTYPYLLRDYIPTISNYGGNTPAYQCPEALISHDGYKAAQAYGLNRKLYINGTDKPAKKSWVSEPSRTFLVGDSCWNGEKMDMSSSINPSGPANLPGTTYQAPRPAVPYHTAGAANIVFVDGHLKYFPDTYVLAETKYRDKGSQDLWSPQK